MIESDFDAFAAVVGGFAELKGRTLSADAIRLYWRAMRHWELQDFKQAAEHLLRTCAFMPTPKDFEDLRKAGRMTAAEAWICARGWANCDGGVSGDPLVDRAARAIGGYELIYLTPLDKLPFLERRFCEHYETLQDAQEIREALPAIAYSSERGAIGAEGPQSVQKLLARLGAERRS